jgi:hypothetical protein
MKSFLAGLAIASFSHLPFASASDEMSRAVQSHPTKASSELPLQRPRQPDGNGEIAITGQLKQWHKVKLTLDGPYAHELDNEPNPFVDFEMKVRFTHESGMPSYTVPGYFAADGNAAETSAASGTKWCAHIAPDKPGRWDYEVSFVQGTTIVESDSTSTKSVALVNGKKGSFHVNVSDKQRPDLRGQGRLQYVGARYLQFAGTGEYFLKAGPDAPETLLAYEDFDGTEARKPSKSSLKSWSPHVNDWRSGDPTWKDGKGKGLIGAINYLSEIGCNAFSFLTYNAGGDGDNVWPFVERDDKLHYDCSKLDQWGIVFDHGTSHGMFLHFKLQENELDDNRKGQARLNAIIRESLDGGELGVQRRLYCREIVARFGHALALNWNLGEENTQSADEQRAMASFLQEVDPYDHPVVIHTFPSQQDHVYSDLLGDKSTLTGASLQNPWNVAHQRTLKWVTESTAVGHPWVVCNDEQNPAGLGVPPDPGYAGHDGIAKVRDPNIVQANGKKPGPEETMGYTLHDIRKRCLWGTLMAGGAGVEYYFGYQLPQDDLTAEDFRSRHQSWKYCRIALDFFRDKQIPIQLLQPADRLVGHDGTENSRYCLAKENELYLVYIGDGNPVSLDLSKAAGDFQVAWFNPRQGGQLASGSISEIAGGAGRSLGKPPADPGEDWLVVVRRR